METLVAALRRRVHLIVENAEEILDFLAQARALLSRIDQNVEIRHIKLDRTIACSLYQDGDGFHLQLRPHVDG